MTTHTQNPPKDLAAQEKHELVGAEPTRAGRFFTPAVDIFENDAAITVLADMPGVSRDDLVIDLRDGVLTIEGTVEDPTKGGESTLLREYDTGGFRREFRLTNLVDQNKIDARLSDGVLRLTLPKAEEARPKRIDVKLG